MAEPLHIQGSLAALVTPMRADGGLDLAAFDRLVEWHIESGTAAVVVVGTTGESATLSADEHCGLVARCVRTADGRIPVVAGTGSNSTQEALHFTRSAREAGADACLLVTPYYIRPPQEGLYRHFRRIAEEVDIPQILYNVPGRTACDLELDTVLRLAELDSVAGVKDATGDLARGLELIERVDGRLAVYSGEDALGLPLMLAGAAGVVSVTANVAPALMAAMCGKALAGDEAGARAADERLAPLHRKLFVQANPVPVKWALRRMGRIGPGIRLPLVELDPRHHAEVAAALERADIRLPSAA